MAEPVVLSSAIIVSAMFASQCSVSLHGTVKGFRSHPKCVRDLLGELEALSAALAPLLDLVKSTSNVDFSLLELPLLRCGEVCKGFQQEILQCASRSNSSQISFHWQQQR